jgi:multidrug efflux pump subunit AcrA (membrane-fusion protein)
MLNRKTISIQRICAALCAALALLRVAPALAADETYAFSAKGSIAAPNWETVAAPVGGQAGNFDWRPGDAVAAGAVAVALTPTQVFAADDGVVRGLRADQGDQAAQVIAQYGALCRIERDTVRQVQATTTSAYDKAENRDVRVGDVLRVLQGFGDNEVSGVGTVIQSAAPGAFVVEMEQGDFDLEETVKLYRGAGEDFKSKDQVGKGKVSRPPTLAVLGDGCVAAVLVEEGQRVTRGQPLFTLDAASARHAEPPALEAAFGRGGVIQEVLIRPGQFVVQGQALMTVLPTDALEAALDVDELDIAKVHVGQSVRVAVDAYPGETRIGAVREILPQGRLVLDTTKFLVKVSFESAEGLMIGMHVTGYWD